jgi:hypothetical protein
VTGFDYARPRATADRLIKRYGMAGKLIRAKERDPYDPNPAEGFDEYPCRVVVTEFSLRDRESSLIEANDRKLLIAAEGLAVEPKGEDRIEVGGASFEIVAVMPLKPADTAILYTVQARS